MNESIKKNFQELLGAAIGGVTGYISNGFFSDWIKPVLISAVCALVGLLITHFGKKALKRLKL